MRVLLGLLGFGLLSALSASGATIEPGTVSFGFPTLQASALGIDTAALAESLCEPDWQGLSSRGNCGSGGSDPGTNQMGGAGALLARVEEHLGSSDATRAVVTLKSLFLDLAPLATDCDGYELWVDLDDGEDQPPSELLIAASDKKNQDGVFSGILRARARLHARPKGGGESLEIPLELQLPVGGPWTLAPARDGASNLVLLARRDDKGWQGARSCLAQPRGCPICITADEKRLKALGASR